MTEMTSPEDSMRLALNQIYEDTKRELTNCREMVRIQDQIIIRLRESLIETNIQLLELSNKVKELKESICKDSKYYP